MIKTMNPIFKEVKSESKAKLISDLERFITDTNFNQANYQLCVLRSVIDNEKAISKDDIVKVISNYNDLTKIKTPAKSLPCFEDSRTYFKNQWVLKSECKFWFKLSDNLNLNKQERTDLLSLIDHKLKGGS